MPTTGETLKELEDMLGGEDKNLSYFHLAYEGLSNKLNKVIDSLDRIFSKEEIENKIVNLDINLKEGLADFKTSFEDLKEYNKAINDILIKLLEESQKPKNKVEVTNLKDTTKISNFDDIKFPDTVKVDKGWLFEQLEDFRKKQLELLNLIPLLERIALIAENIKFPQDPNNPVAVRLSDGKKFYTAVMQAVAKGVIPFKTASGVVKEATVDNNGNIVVTVSGTLSVNAVVIASYDVNHTDEASDTLAYVGYENNDGDWYIEKVDSSSGVVHTYATITNNPTKTTYSLAWADRASLTYNIKSVAKPESF